METKEQERLAEDIIEGRVEEEVATVDEMSMVNDHISDDLSEKTLAGSDEETRFEFVEAKLRRIEASTESDEREETENGASTEDSDGVVSTVTKDSERKHTNQAITLITTISSPNSQRSTEKDGSTMELSEREQSEEVVIKKAEGSEPKSDEDHLGEIEWHHILLKAVIFFWTSIRDFFVDSKYFLSKCTLPNSNGMALLR